MGAAPSGGTRPLASEIDRRARRQPGGLELADHLGEPARRDAEEDVVGPRRARRDWARRAARAAARRRPGTPGSRGRPPAAAACSGVRACSVVRKPPRASSTATAVPNEPAPSTTARREPGVGSENCGRGGIGHPTPERPRRYYARPAARTRRRAPRPPPRSPPASWPPGTHWRSMIRLPNGSSASRADDRVQRHAALARAGADLADELALQRLLVELALAGDHGARRRACARRSRARRAPTGRPARAPRRSAAHSPPDSPPAPPVIGTPRGSRGNVRACSSQPLVSRPTIAGSAPFCGPNTFGAPPRTACARRTGRRSARRPGRRPPRSPRARPRRRPWSPSRRRPTRITCAPASRRRRSARRCRRSTPPTRRARPRRPASTRRRAVSTIAVRRPPPARSPP